MKKLLLLFTISMFFNVSFACTDFRITAKDGTVLVTRSMEYAVDFQSNLRSTPRGRTFTTTTPDGKSGLTWKSKQGYVYLDGMQLDFAIDGMNEKGLSFEALYLPNFAEYQTVPENQAANSLPYYYLGDWILGNFQNVNEVKEAINKIFVYDAKIPGGPDMTFPLHFAVYDATGSSIIIEYIGGKLSVYDNKIGIMTNSPGYSWHLNNLNNYVHLTPINPPDVMIDGVRFGSNGQGFGMIGMPGDISPPSRFVKTTALTHVALPADTAEKALNLAQHVINNVDIVRGEVREPQSGKYVNETTEWVVFKDLTHKKFYYRTYDDLSLRSVSLDKINFAENAPRLKMPIASQQAAKDMTDQFLGSKN